MYSAVADMGGMLALVRDGHLYRAEGFDSFDAYCAERVPAMVPAEWNLTPSQVAELIETAFALAGERWRKPGRR